MTTTPPTRWLLGAGSAVVAGAGFVLATQLVGTPNRSTAVVQSLTPWVIPVLLVTVLVASLVGDDRIGYPATALTVVYLVVVTPLAFPADGPRVPDDATTFRVMSANVLYSNARVDAATATFAAADADVVALSEVTPEIAESIRTSEAAVRYPHRIEHPADRAGGLMLLSRFPVVDVPVDGFRRAIDAEVTTPDGPVRVLVVHPPPPVFNHQVWSRELAALPDLALRSDDPLVVIGDFNASWFHPPFRQMLGDAGLRDALTVTGGGLTMTWPSDELVPPFVTLDHVLVGDTIAALDGGTVATPGSDHRAVVATLALAER